MIKLLPSLLAADFANLATEITTVEKTQIDLHHIDVMDGHFVPNISFGPVVLDAVNKIAQKPLDIHLMISHPAQYLEKFIAYNPEYICFHIEIADDIPELIKRIKASKIKVGIALKPGTAVATVLPYLSLIDMVLVMSVEPGFGGQKFMSTAVAKIVELNTIISKNNYNVEIEVDGGINKDTAKLCKDAGATMLVAGSTVYNKQATYEENVKLILDGLL